MGLLGAPERRAGGPEVVEAVEERDKVVVAALVIVCGGDPERHAAVDAGLLRQFAGRFDAGLVEVEAVEAGLGHALAISTVE